MKLTITFLVLLVLSFAAFGQNKTAGKKPATVCIPEVYSSVFDIRGFERYMVMVSSENPQKSSEAIEKILSRELSIKPVKSSTETQFFIFYRETKNGSQMRVKYNKEDRVVIVWAEDRKGKGKGAELAEEFLKVLQRNKKLDVPDEPADAK